MMRRIRPRQPRHLYPVPNVDPRVKPDEQYVLKETYEKDIANLKKLITKLRWELRSFRRVEE